MAGIGLKRLGSQIRLVISNALQTKLSDPRLERVASILRVELSTDLSFADVYISVMGTEGQQRAYMQALDSARGILQSRLARTLRTRTCPTLRLHLDQSLKTGLATTQLIDKTITESAAGRESPGEGPEGLDRPEPTGTGDNSEYPG